MDEHSTTTSSTSSSSPPPSQSLSTILNSIQALGRGFDVTSDIRLLYCKGIHGARLVKLDEQHIRDLTFLSCGSVKNVSADIGFATGQSGRETTPVLSFHEMAEYFNKKAHISGSIPLGSFNAMFNLTGSWQADATSTKALAVDGYYVSLFVVYLNKSDLVLQEDVRRVIPSTWEPSSLASFIESFGTHIITSATIGGRDVVYVKQHESSLLSEAEIKDYLRGIGDQRFSELDTVPSSGPLKYKDKAVDPFSFNQEVHPQPSSAPSVSGKEDITVIFRRRGGDDLVQSHRKWEQTVHVTPDVINMTFVPISSLLDEVPGRKHLTRAIDLYLEYKPPIEELQYFLEFQIPRVWAPIQDELPGHQRKEPVLRSLQFSLMGSKLYVSSDQVNVGRKLVTGLRLYLEGTKKHRLSVHVQHLASLPKILQPHWDAHVAIGAPKWHGPEEQDSRWFEPVKWKNFSHVSTAPIEITETYIDDLSGVHVVTGAQLGVWEFGSKSVLYLKLLFSRVPGCTIRRSVWDHTPKNLGQKASESSSSLSSSSDVKLTKFIDLTEMTKGPQDVPGHWLVTGAKLGVDKGKIVLRVKYSLLNY